MEDKVELTIGTLRVRGECEDLCSTHIPLIIEAYLKDALYKQIVAQPKEHSAFEVRDRLIWT